MLPVTSLDVESRSIAIVVSSSTSMPQPTLQQLFGVSSAKASSGNVGLSETVTGSINEHKGCATAAEETTQQLQL